MVSIRHSYVDKLTTQVYTPEVTTKLPGTAQRIAILTTARDKMDARDNAHKEFLETEEIQNLDVATNADTKTFRDVVKFMSTNASVPAAKRAAAKRIWMEVKNLTRLAHSSQSSGADKIKDVMNHLLAEPLHADVVTIEQLALVQQIKTENDQRILLRYNRKQVSDTRRDDQGMIELCDGVEPDLEELYEITEVFAINGTAEQKAAAATAIFNANAALGLAQTDQRRHETTIAKQHGDDSGENSGGSSGGHKPHDPNKPSTDPNRPEGPEPNDGDDDDNNSGGDDNNGGDDSGDDDDNTGGDDDHNGGDDNNNSGDSGGSGGGNNNGGSDKPPNPESPD